MSTSQSSCSRTTMLGYSVGECANSLIMNSLFGYAMLYYTDALGLAHASAGIAMAVAVFWDAITDPMMGHISDNTKSRFGRRHPYMLLGGLATILTYIFLWYVPSVFTSDMTLLFWYLVGINLLQRTAITVFYVPYVALGFEVCTDYSGRVTLQGIRSAMNMFANILGPGLSWAIFFSNNEGIRATSVAGNYLGMGLTFSAIALISVIGLLFLTRKYANDSRNLVTEGNSIGSFFKDMREIVSDRYPRFVFLFIMVATIGIALVSSLQMYLYEHFMHLGGIEKTITHGGSMVGFGIGSLVASALSRKFDKKGAIFFGGILSIGANAVLALCFLPGILVPGQTVQLFSYNFPIAYVVFTLFHALYWTGNGILFPTSISMMADVSEINEIKTGINKDAAYAAVYSFAQKCAISFAVLVSGYTLMFIGFEDGKEIIQSAATTWRLCAATLIAGPLVTLVSLALIKFYPVTNAMLDTLRAAKPGTSSGITEVRTSPAGE
jgi:glycoside/pentoside/hexuronide:cation symporter, GPH family